MTCVEVHPCRSSFTRKNPSITTLTKNFEAIKVINIGSKVYVHITGLKNGSVPVNQHTINLKKCSITDGYGLQEVLLIQGFLRNSILSF